MRSLTRRSFLQASVLAPAAVRASAAPQADPRPASATVAEIGARYLDLLAEDSPLLRMRSGRPLKLPDLTLAHAEARARTAAELQARLAAVSEAGLSEEDQLSRALLARRLSFDAGAVQHYWLGFDVTPYASPLGQAHVVLRALPLRTKAEADAFVDLLGQYPALVEQVRVRLRAQAERGIRVPKDELAVVKAFLAGALEPGAASAFELAGARLSSLATAEAEALRARLAAQSAVARRSLQALVDDLGPAYAASAPEAVGLSQYPGGRAAYEALVRRHTTLEVTPEEVHRIGLEEVARLASRMQEVRARIGFTGDAAAFREAVAKDARFRAATPEAVGERLMSYIARIEPKVAAFFLRKPRAPYGVKRLDAEREPALTFGIYEQPSALEPRGLYRFNGSRLDERTLLTAGPLVYHELVPGHHFQLALAAENASLPAYRRELWDTAFVEGWGEYASALAEEMGMYQDPYDLYGRLAMDMFLTVRLVVDTGLNALGWPRAKAKAFMREHLIESDTQIETESLRYSTDIPGQALAYKMGSRGLLELRRKAESSLGPRFDLRRFHDCVLGSGSLPLEVLSRKVDRFVAREK